MRLRRTHLLILLTAFVAGGAGGWALALRSATPAGPTVAVTPAVATQDSGPSVATRPVEVAVRTFQRAITLDGDIENLYSPQVSAEISGQVQEVLVEPGDAVTAGQLVARIDPVDAQLSVAADRAEVERLKAIAADKQAIVRRLTPLAAQDLVSAASITTARQDAAAAAAAVKAAEAKLRLSERNAEKAQVRAPFDGVVAERMVAPGAYVRTGDVVLSVVREAGSRVRATVPERYSAQVRAGQQATVTLANGQTFESRVETVRPAADQFTRSVQVHLTIPEHVQVRPGASARVDLVLDEEAGLAVPETAVVTEGAKSFAYVLDDGQARKTEVTPGLRQHGLVQVLEGLSAGQRVGADASFLYDGARLKEAAQ